MGESLLEVEKDQIGLKEAEQKDKVDGNRRTFYSFFCKSKWADHDYVITKFWFKLSPVWVF